MCHQPSHLLITSHSSASRYCVVQHGARFVLYVLQLSRSTHCFQYATKMIFLICHFLFTKMPTVTHCAIALSLLITSPLALTLQQNFLRQIATNTHLPSSSQKPYHIFIITPHLAHPPCKKRLALGPAKIKLTRTTLPISHLRHAEHIISLIQSCTT